MPGFVLVYPGDLATPTGGYRYDRRIVEDCLAVGWTVDEVSLSAAFPAPAGADLDHADQALSQCPDGTLVVCDGLAFGAMPDVAASHALRLRLVALVHHPLCDETGIGADDRERLFESERQALSHARHVIVTSPATARRLADFDVPPERISVVVPGVDIGPAATPHAYGPCRLICVASLTPRKGHDALLTALARCDDLDWQLTLVGPTDLDPAHADRVAEQAEVFGDRVTITGPLPQQDVAAALAASDAFVLASHYEGYGMAFVEAIAAGLPIVATAGGATADTIPAGTGLLSPPGDVEALAANLRCIIGDWDRREEMRRAAVAAREHLQSWRDAGAAFRAALEQVA